MVEIARALGQFSRQLRDLSREFSMALQAEIDAAEKEAAETGADLREVQEDVQNVLTGAPQRESYANGRSDASVTEDE
jgi:Sec-independent protein translocase protein TatA